MRQLFTPLAFAFCTGLANLSHASDVNGLLSKALEDRSIPAMAVLVIKDGKVEQQAVQGVRAMNSTVKASLDDAWHIGSDTKAMTATMIAKLVERGVLSWTAPLSRMLPNVAMHADYRDVTLADLLSHRAGLPPIIDEQKIESYRKDPRSLRAVRAEYINIALSEKPVAAARQAANYSNSGYLVAAAIAERATDKSFETLMQDEIYGPLDMVIHNTDLQAHELLGHKAGKPLSGPESDIPAFFAPAGSTTRLTLQDWAKFAIDQMAGEHGKGKLLRKESYQFLHTPQGDTPSALGWGIKNAWPKTAPIRMLTHAGSNEYWYALIALAPDFSGGVLVAANVGEDTGVAVAERNLLLSVMADLAGKK